MCNSQGTLLETSKHRVSEKLTTPKLVSEAIKTVQKMYRLKIDAGIILTYNLEITIKITYAINQV